MILVEGEALKIRTVCKWQKFKNSNRDLMRDHHDVIDKEFGYFRDIQHFNIINRIMADSIIPGCIRL